jgi:uncharacterized protein CbrC (UPF0167 family)
VDASVGCAPSWKQLVKYDNQHARDRSVYDYYLREFQAQASIEKVYGLPTFRYHPPDSQWQHCESGKQCRCCRSARGYIYTGSVYSSDDLDDSLCPWCIADVSAHAKFDATFVDTEAFADGIPESVIDEISERTPGYSSWQSEHWPACCDDATVFLAPVGSGNPRALPGLEAPSSVTLFMK